MSELLVSPTNNPDLRVLWLSQDRQYRIIARGDSFVVHVWTPDHVQDSLPVEVERQFINELSGGSWQPGDWEETARALGGWVRHLRAQIDASKRKADEEQQAREHQRLLDDYNAGNINPFTSHRQ